MVYYGQGDELHLSFNFLFFFVKWNVVVWCDCIEIMYCVFDLIGVWFIWVFLNYD